MKFGAEFFAQALPLMLASFVCFANGWRCLRMKPWEYERERRNLRPMEALRDDIRTGRTFD